MSDTIASMREQISAATAAAEAELAQMRTERDAMNDRIRAKVREYEELRSAQSKLTPRKAKRASTESSTVEPEVDPADAVA